MLEAGGPTDRIDEAAELRQFEQAGSTVNFGPIKPFRSRCNRLFQRALAA
jgi:hypothetical protein